MRGRQCREDRPRHPEDHRVQVDQENHRDHSMLTSPAQTLGNGSESGRRATTLRRHRSQLHDRVHRNGEGHGVGRVRGLESCGGDDNACEQRPYRAAQLEGQLIQRLGRGDAVSRQQPWNEGRASRLVDREKCALQSDHGVKQP